MAGAAWLAGPATASSSALSTNPCNTASRSSGVSESIQRMSVTSTPSSTADVASGSGAVATFRPYPARRQPVPGLTTRSQLDADQPNLAGAQPASGSPSQ